MYGTTRIWVLVWSLLQVACEGEPLRFAFFTHPTSEHFTSAILAEELASRGHHVTLGGFKSRKKDTPASVQFLTVGDDEAFVQAYRNITVAVQMLSPSESGRRGSFEPFIWPVARPLQETMHASITSYFEELESKNALPQLCVFAWLMESCWDLCLSRNISVVTQNLSILAGPFLSSNPSLPMESLLDLDYPGRPHARIRNRSLKERLHSILGWVYVQYLFRLVKPWQHTILTNKAYRRTLRIVQTVPGFDFPAEHSPLVQYTGPLFSEGLFDPERISANVTTFLSESQGLGLPVIYVSFGTLIQLPPMRLVEVLNGLKSEAGNLWRVLWASQQWEELERLLGDSPSPHIKIVKWTKGPAVIAHDAVRIFFGNCGSNGVHEAIYKKKPVFGMPIFGDQMAICDRVRHSGTGTSICHYSATSAAVRDALKEMLTNYDTYAANAERLSLIMKTQGGVTRAGDLVEQVAILGGNTFASLWSSPSEAEGFFKPYCLDIIGFLLIAFFAAGFVVAKLPFPLPIVCMLLRACQHVVKSAIRFVATRRGIQGSSVISKKKR